MDVSRWNEIVFVFCAAALVGCSDGRPQTVPVRGTVKYQGKPVTTGRVVFYPEKGRSAQGDIQTDGTFTLTTFEQNDGAIVGKHRVTVKSTRVVQVAGAPQSFKEELRRGAEGKPAFASTQEIQWLVPKKYSQRGTTTLGAEVTDGENQIDLMIP